MMIRLNDSQVLTLIFILVNQPPVPMDMDRYPTVRMFLDKGIVLRVGSKLHCNHKAPEFVYQHVVSANVNLGECTTFEQMEKAGLLAYTVAEQSDSYYWYHLVQLREKVLALGGDFDPDAGTCSLPEGCEATAEIQECINNLKESMS